MYAPIRNSLRVRARTFARVYAGLTLVEPRTHEHHAALEAELRVIDHVAPPCAFVWLGVGYRRIRWTPAKLRHSPIPLDSDALPPTAVARIQRRCKLVYYETEPAPKPNLVSLPFFDAVWSYSTFHHQFAAPCDDRGCDRPNSSAVTPPWSYVPPLFVQAQFVASHEESAPILLSGMSRHEWESRNICPQSHGSENRQITKLPANVRVLGARNASDPQGLWTPHAFRKALANASLIVNLHKDACTPLAAQPLETFRLSQVLSVGLIVVSQRCVPTDERIFAGLVDFYDDADALWMALARYGRMSPSERRVVGMHRRRLFAELSEQIALPEWIGSPRAMIRFAENVPTH